MVINTETLYPLHDLTEEGLEHYQSFLRDKANDLLIKKSHKIIHFLKRLVSFLGFSNTLIDQRYNKLMADLNDRCYP